MISLSSVVESAGFPRRTSTGKSPGLGHVFSSSTIMTISADMPSVMNFAREMTSGLDLGERSQLKVRRLIARWPKA